MLEHARKRKPENTPIRIRPPDNTIAESSESPLSELRLPAREAELPRWLSVEQVRKIQRMRRETVIAAMRNGELPFERRGRICYIRLTDVIAWEERRLQGKTQPTKMLIHPDLVGLL